MAIHRALVVSVLVILGFVSNTAQSLRFDLQSGRAKCITEDIKSNSMTVGKYAVVNPSKGHPLPESHKLTVRLTSTYGNSYHHAESVELGQFAFQAVEAGDYMTCFFSAEHQSQATITVEFEWKTGVAAKDWTNVAKKGSVDAMELELKKMFETVASIHDEMFYLRESGFATVALEDLFRKEEDYMMCLSWTIL
ncbi:emp24/gp25L/p24 family/GOLD family protein [Actinidia rufa]|uniref:Emp24/gp25L/p24 family/GOLD family protein n=1 Tax=Actinidia rufa TaxID=165716 RepID=A0A7J0G3T7_9ERIC|nr:emp24/gp25L/p24 family/GOLD family protein [Actinidia rufa]